MTDPSVNRALAYNFLEAIREKFCVAFDKQQVENAIPYGLKSFDEQLKSAMVILTPR